MNNTIIRIRKLLFNAVAVIGVNSKMIITGALTLYLALLSNSAMAFLFYDGTPKWGSSTIGAGATVTWSLIPDGTDVLRTADLPSLPSGTNEFLFQDFWSGPSDLASVYGQLDANPVTGATLFRNALTNAFSVWAAAADLTFIEVSDTGLQLAHPDATGANAGDIRIGAFPLTAPFDCCAAFGFEPPGGTDFLSSYNPTATGDLSLNSLALFGVASGIEGDPFDFSGGFFNDIEGLLIHEIGHALGLEHPEADGLSSGEADALMYVGSGCCDNIQRTLAVDDIAGIGALYGTRGSSTVPEPSAFALLVPALFGLISLKRRRTLARS